MLAGPAQLAVKTKIRTVDRLGLLDPSLLEEKRPERMTGRLHPSPGLVIGQRVAELDRPPQVREGGVKVGLSISSSPFSIASATPSRPTTELLCTRRLSGTRVFAAMNNAFSASASATLPSAEWATALA